MAKRREKVDVTYHGALRRALINARTYGTTYYVRPATGNTWCVTDVQPKGYIVKAVPCFPDHTKSELRNHENWPIDTREFAKEAGR